MGSGGTGGQSQPPPPQKEAFFNTPQGGAGDLAIEAKITELVDLAVPGSTVRVALFHWTRAGMATPFVEAAARGVDVKIVLDKDNLDQNGEHNAAVKALEAGLPAGSLTICRDGQATGACIGTNINHNKFFLFSELADGSKNVVVQSSANFTKTQTELWNNLVIVRDDAALHAGYLQYWSDLKAQKLNPNYYTVIDGTTNVRAYFFPRETGDTVEGVLDNANCPGTNIRLAMAIFTTGRTNIANKLVSLKKAGCSVEAVLGTGAAAEIISTLKAGGVNVLPFEAPTGESVHSKYLLIDGTYNGAPDRKIVWTGSHNYSDNALRDNDETLLKVDDAPVFDAYLDNWLKLKAAATP
jgi:phosphatidylserine/phosphatidylglycerophosphate/cardiolipin synthase-like enzyme